MTSAYAREGGFVAVTAAHAAADGEVVSTSLVILHDGDQPGSS